MSTFDSTINTLSKQVCMSFFVGCQLSWYCQPGIVEGLGNRSHSWRHQHPTDTARGGEPNSREYEKKGRKKRWSNEPQKLERGGEKKDQKMYLFYVIDVLTNSTTNNYGQ